MTRNPLIQELRDAIETLRFTDAQALPTWHRIVQTLSNAADEISRQDFRIETLRERLGPDAPGVDSLISYEKAAAFAERGVKKLRERAKSPYLYGFIEALEEIAADFREHGERAGKGA